MIFLSASGFLQASENIPPQDISVEIVKSIKEGDAKTLAKYFTTTIDLTIPGSEGAYSKVQAEQIMREFFTKNPPASFKINHNGVSNDGSKFYIGTYVSSKKNYRTYFLLKKISGTYYIQQLRFEID